MPPRPHPRLDAVDLRILEELQRDGRCTNAVLASLVGLSESACSKRLRRLERTGVIEGYRALIRDGALGPSVTILAQVKLEASGPAQLRAFERLIERMPQVVECELVTGEFDYLLRVVVPDTETYMAFSDRVTQQFEGIRTWVSNVQLRRIKSVPVPMPAAGKEAQAGGSPR
jgi:DNA-binding Lrp family transcriptional regulator